MASSIGRFNLHALLKNRKQIRFAGTMEEHCMLVHIVEKSRFRLITIRANLIDVCEVVLASLFALSG